MIRTLVSLSIIAFLVGGCAVRDKQGTANALEVAGQTFEEVCLASVGNDNATRDRYVRLSSNGWVAGRGSTMTINNKTENTRRGLSTSNQTRDYVNAHILTRPELKSGGPGPEARGWSTFGCGVSVMNVDAVQLRSIIEEALARKGLSGPTSSRSHLAPPEFPDEDFYLTFSDGDGLVMAYILWT